MLYDKDYDRLTNDQVVSKKASQRKRYLREILKKRKGFSEGKGKRGKIFPIVPNYK